MNLKPPSSPSQADQLTVPFSDRSRSGTVKVNLLAGSISVKPSTTKDVLVTSRALRETRRNQPAVYHMLGWSDGWFAFTVEKVGGEIDVTATELLMEGARLLDESKRR